MWHQIMKLRWQVHGNEKERFMVNQRNRNIRAIQDDDRMVPIKPDIVSLFDSQSRQRYQVTTSFSDKEGIMKT